MQLIEDQHMPHTNLKSSQAGFTLVELAIVTLIFAMVTLPLLGMYADYVKREKRKETIERINNVSSQLRIYRPSTFSYPCPADRALGRNDAMFGLENCAAFAALAINTCSANGGICRVQGSRDTDLPTNGLNDDSVLIGAVPFRTIDAITINNMGIDGSMDTWGGKLTYAVSQKNTTLAPFARNSLAVGNDFKYGVIAALDENGSNTAGIGLFDLDNADADNDLTTGRDGDGQFAIISHGPTNFGAYSLDGALINACDATTIDGENCDNDFTFRSAIGNYDAAGATFYDDIALFFRDNTGDLWGFIENPQGGATSHIRKLNAGRVGVNTGTAAVTTPLDVNGSVRAKTSLVMELCKKDGTNCVPTQYLYNQYNVNTVVPTTSDPAKSWRNTCTDFGDGTTQVMNGITSGIAQCVSSVNIPAPPGGADVDCPAGTYIQSILTNGCIVCTDGITYPSALLCN